MVSIIRKFILYVFPKSPLDDYNNELSALNKLYEDRKIIKIIRKDNFDLKYGHMVENGVISPEEYYRLKTIHQQGYLS